MITVDAGLPRHGTRVHQKLMCGLMRRRRLPPRGTLSRKKHITVASRNGWTRIKMGLTSCAKSSLTNKQGFQWTPAGERYPTVFFGVYQMLTSYGERV